MANYKANVYLVHNGKIVQTGQNVELTEKQAKRLGEKVSLSQQIEFEDKTVPELKELAKEQGIEGFNDMKKAELISALSE